MIMRSFTRKEKKMWLLTLFLKNIKMKGPFFPSPSLYQISFVHQEWIHDPKISHIFQQFKTNSLVSQGYSWHSDELHYKGHFYLSNKSQIKSKMLSNLHATPTVGHSRFTKTYDRVKKYFF
jgi:hypothetical protein